MGRNRNRRKTGIGIELFSLPVVGLVSIVFLMLAYYLASHKPEAENTFFDVNVQDASSMSAPTLFFTVDVKRIYSPDDDIIYIMNGRSFYLKDLVNTLKEIARTAPGMTAVINLGPEARYKKLISLIDACSCAGIRKICLVSGKPLAPAKN